MDSEITLPLQSKLAGVFYKSDQRGADGQGKSTLPGPGQSPLPRGEALPIGSDFRLVYVLPQSGADSCLAGLADPAIASRLESINGDGSDLSEIGLAQLKYLSKLKNLTLRGAKFLLSQIAGAAGTSSLVTLNLDGLVTPDDRLRALLQVCKSAAMPDDTPIGYLERTMTLAEWDKEIREQQSDTGPESFRKLNTLKILNLTSSKVYDVDLESIGELSSLQSLFLGNCVNLTNEVFSHLSALTNLKTLYLGHNHKLQLTDSALRHLYEMRSLEELNIAIPYLSDSGVAYLSRMTALTKLELLEECVTDAVVAHLQELPNLKTLGLDGLNIPDARIQELKNKLPELDIQWGLGGRLEWDHVPVLPNIPSQPGHEA
ncbi:hypothetical protein OAU50_08405 [Planctomycetota bacterium]|nr:hypothetical protein [Planctomycetota bacterium]